MATKFGIEFEMMNITGNEVLAAIVGAGAEMPAEVFGYHSNAAPDCNSGQFHMMSDSSINGSTCTMTRKGSVELVSPILNGEFDLRMINRILTALNNSGASVDRSCGTHISVGLNGKQRWERMSVSKKADVANRIVAFYNYYQPVFDAISPNCRRQGSDEMSVPLRSARPVYQDGSASGGRYSVINLAHYITYGRIEFRQVGMTLDKKKVAMWLKVINSMVSMALNENHVSRTMTLEDMPKTLTGFVTFLGIGPSLEKTLRDRILHMAQTYRGQRAERYEILSIAFCGECGRWPPASAGCGCESCDTELV